MRLCGQAPLSPYPPGAPLTDRQIEVMAPAIHETYTALDLKTGSLKKGDEKSFDQLDTFLKDSNRAAAARMLTILNLIGLRLTKGSASPAEESAVRAQLEYSLEALAEAEHDAWMDWHFARGWRYGRETNRAQQIHQCLRPYTQLAKVDTDKDRDAIRHYPDFARTAGLKIIFPAATTATPARR